MKSSLNHLPEFKQKQILQIAKIIQDVVQPEMIILFGSYAKGAYVEHGYAGRDGIHYEYISDYDFLVVTKDNSEKVGDIEQQIFNLTESIEPDINLEIHSIAYVNKGQEL